MPSASPKLPLMMDCISRYRVMRAVASSSALVVTVTRR